MVYVTVVLFAHSNERCNIPFVPLFLSVLRLYGHHLSPRGRVPVNAYALSTPISVLFREPERSAQKLELAGVNHCSPESVRRGGGPPS